MSSPQTPPVLCLVGQTAVGKSGVGIALARLRGGEVVSCDAFGVYAGMTILAAAPHAPPDVPHHLVGILDPVEPYSAARFAADADRVVAGIRARGREPLVVGGTALYLRSWLHGFGAPVGRDEPYRDTLRARAATEGPEALHRTLQALDPARAAQLHPNDVRRVIRALEIARVTGRPPSAQRGQWARPAQVDARVVGLRRRPDDLECRIRRRTAQMFAAGVVDEARALLRRPLAPEARQALGLDVLERLLHAETSEAEAITLIARKTRQLARKQMTFFRGFPDITFVDVEPEEDDATIARRILDGGAAD